MEDDNIKNEAPILFGLKKHEPFNAPDGYFESLPNRLQKNIALEQKRGRIIKLSSITIGLSIAASIFAFVFWFNKPVLNNMPQLSAYEIFESTALNDIDEYELVLLTDTLEIKSENTDIETYLLETNIEEETLIAALN